MALKKVIERVLNDESLNSEELQELASWLASDKGMEDFYEALQEDEGRGPVKGDLDYDILLKRLHGKIDRKRQRSMKGRIRRYLWLATSAAAIIVVGLLGWMRWMETETVTCITPSTHKAILTLTNGKDVLLDQKQSEEIILGGTIIQVQDNQIVYNHDSLQTMDSYNQLAVQRGGEYSITLTDGTVVWMNSDSKLKYPMQFTGQQRRVFLVGEAYFEVAPDPERPFVVVTNCQEIEVLGTKFNVCAYPNEMTVTTLVEGSVNLSNSVTLEECRLVPGEQAVIDPVTNEMTVSQVNAGDIIAWTQGMFVFNDNTLDQVMQKLERWYDLPVNYIDSRAKEITFKGNLPRYSDLKTVLNMIEKVSPARFKIDRQQVIVSLK